MKITIMNHKEQRCLQRLHLQKNTPKKEPAPALLEREFTSTIITPKKEHMLSTSITTKKEQSITNAITLKKELAGHYSTPKKEIPPNSKKEHYNNLNNVNILPYAKQMSKKYPLLHKLRNQ